MRQLLIEWREGRNLTREALAQRIGCNVRTVTRWETGERVPRIAQRTALAEALGRSVADIMRAIDDTARPIDGHTVPSHLTHFASCEQGASELRCWEPIVIPGLLQTAEYAAAVERMSITNPSESEVAERVKLRLWRQAVLSRPENPLRLFAVVDRSTLMREIGGNEVMDAQLAHLLEMATSPNVAIRVAPLATVPAAGWGPFRLLTGAGHSPYMATTEDLSGFSYHELPYIVRAYVDLWERLWEDSHDLAQEHLQRR